MRVRTASFLAVAAGALAIAGLVAGVWPAPPARPAARADEWNLRITPGGGACHRSEGASAPAAADACGSFQAAYRAAQPGDRIMIGGGRYSSQSIAMDERKARARASVVFEPGPGQDVVLDGDLTVAASRAVFRGHEHPHDFHVRYVISLASSGPTTSSHVAFEQLDGAAFVIGPNDHISIVGGDWGPNTLTCGGANQYENKITADDSAGARVPTAILLEGLRIHDQNSTDLACQHMGGLVVSAADGLTIRNSHWSQTAVYDIEAGDFTHGRYGNPRNVLITGNWFGAPVLQDGSTDDGQAEIQLAEPGRYEHWRVRDNAFTNGPALNFDGNTELVDVEVTDNVGRRADCAAAAEVTWRGNEWIERPCSADDRKIATLPYRRTTIGAEDYRRR
jgi:hypothetical protein